MASVHNVIVPVSLVDQLLADHPIDAETRRLRALTPRHEPDVMASPRDPIAACAQSYLAALAADEPDRRTARRVVGLLTAKFDNDDVAGYLGSFWTYFGKIKKAAWRTLPTVAEAMPDRPTIALFADWGTGLYGAPAIGSVISAYDPPIDLAIHLGDVYYSGTKREYADRVTGIWPRGAKVSRACNGNHDMYSGGRGYFEFITGKGQSASGFAFVNEDWLLLGLDTAYIDADIGAEQMQWIDRMVGQYTGRRVILVSHHQPWSVFADDHHAIKNLPAKVHPLADGKIDSWYWGHEHRCAIYNRHPAYGTYGRCLGIGGFPYKRDTVTRLRDIGDGWYAFYPSADCAVGGMLLDRPNGWLDESYGVHGFARLTLDHDGITESIVTAYGDLVWRQTRTRE